MMEQQTDTMSFENTIENSAIPSGWKWVKFGDVCKVQGGFAFKSSEYQKSGVPLVRISNLVNGIVNFDSNTVYLSENKLELNRDFILQKGDTLIAMSGATTGKMATFETDSPALLNQRVGRFRILSDSFCSLRFISLLVSQITKKVLQEAYGAAQPNISPTQIEQFDIPLPPLPEQHQIVAEIEKQFTRLDAGVAALKRVQANLKRYRAAVLKAACEGKLVPTEVELARAANRTYEPADQLLARILTERRKKWNGKDKYKEPAEPDTINLPDLPAGWSWASLDALAEIKGGITKDQKRKFAVPARSIPYLRVANVQRGYLDLTEIKEIFATEDEISELALKPGDILFNEGGDRDKLGRGWIWNDEISECIHQNHVFRARLFDQSVNPKFVSWYANTFGQQFFFDEGKHTTNLASISMSKLKCLPVPIPPAAEQIRIVAEIERRLSVVDELETVVEANLQRATRLRQSVLQKAFSGGFN